MTPEPPEPVARHPLDPAEAARIEAAYGVRVRPDTRVARYAMGAGVLWGPVNLMDDRPAAFRRLHRARRIAAAPRWQPEGQSP